jgi:dTDP-4-amino-4,6-dideoxygalactose transaminase
MATARNLPALLGGVPIRPEGPPSWPFSDDDVRDALQEAYRDGSWGKYHGAYVARLTKALAEYLGQEFVLPCGSGTFAVELALRALKIGPGDEVLLAAYDYPGHFQSIHAVGAHPVLIDIDVDNWNLAPALLPAATGPKTRAIIVSHLHGGLVPMREVMDFARSRCLAVIEDAAQAPGALIQAKKAGTCGDVSIWSFGGSKLLSAGRGGALFVQRPDVYQRARTWMHRGNQLCPLSELQAAVLLPQLVKLDERNNRRVRNVERLSALLGEVPGIRPLLNHTIDSRPVYYKVGLQHDADQFGLPRARLLEAARAEGIALDDGFAAAHMGRSPRRFRRAGDLTQAERAHAGMMILHHPVLLGTEADINQVAQSLKRIHDFRMELQVAAV